MNHFTPCEGASYKRRLNQNGISLLMVMLVLILVALTAVSASRSSLFNETVTGNEADYNRALAAAEALVHDAQLDIMGVTATGAPCNAGANFIGCRLSAGGIEPLPTQANPFFPERGPTFRLELGELRTVLNNACTQGICAPQIWPDNALPSDFWLTPATLAANTPNAAWYGRFTGAVPATTGNPILTVNPRQAWYWVELFESLGSGPCAATPALCANGSDPLNPAIYRITAVAQGNRPNTVAAIQTFFVPFVAVP